MTVPKKIGNSLEGVAYYNQQKRWNRLKEKAFKWFPEVCYSGIEFFKGSYNKHKNTTLYEAL